MTRASAQCHAEPRFLGAQELELREPCWDSHLVEICVERYSHTHISDLIKMKKYMLCARGLENASLGRRPRAAFSSPRSQFFPIYTDRP